MITENCFELAREVPEMDEKLQCRQRVDSRCDIIHYNSGSLGQPFQLPHRRRLHDIERPKKYKARQHRFPRHRSE